MKKDSVKLFVPGRLCLIGEHSDWSSTYKNKNNDIILGKAISTSLDIGIFAYASISDKYIINYLDDKKINTSDVSLGLHDNFFKYIFSVISILDDKYNVSGINLNIYKVTLPMKKGLASSAAICLLTVRAFNILYKLNLSREEEIEISFVAEKNIGSKCGILDQVSVSSIGTKLINFNSKTTSNNIVVSKDVHMVIVDLMSRKDTIKILSDLNMCYPFPKNKKEEAVHNFLGKQNEEFVLKAKKCLEKGDVKGFGRVYTSYQKSFDKALRPCSSELEAPILHKILSDSYIKELIYGGKGCGSGGDGSAQFVCKDLETSLALCEYLNKQYNMDTYKTIIRKNKITKAIIPVGGFGSRMYPMTKIINKELLPLKDKDGIIKPAILILFNELIKSGIEEIYLVLSKEHKKLYSKLFKKNSNYSASYEDELLNIKKKIFFVEDDTHLGMGNAICLCKDKIKEDDFIFLLGDQIYKSYEEKMCISQALEFYYNNSSSVVCTSKCKKSDASKYGVLTGDLKNNYFKIDNYYEKPDLDTLNKISDKDYFYAMFGIYIFKNNFLNYLEKNKDFTLALHNYIESNETMSFIPNGRYFDIGNMESYYDSFINFS